MTDHDPGDEQVDRGHQLHLLWPARDAAFWQGNGVQIGRVVRCGQLVPVHWATNVEAIVDCEECRR